MQTITNVYQNIEVLAAVETAISIQFYKLFLAHLTTTGMVLAQPFTQTGAVAPFTQTSTYTFPAETALVERLSTYLNNASVSHLTSMSATPTSVTAVHTYANSADYTSSKFFDYGFLAANGDALTEAGCVRTIAYAMV
jgi:hypothetical protein